MKDLIKGIFSLEERRFSTLMFSYIAFSTVGIYLLVKTGSMPSPLSYVIISIAGLIAGVNVVPSIMNSSGQNNYFNNNSNYQSNTKNIDSNNFQNPV